MAGPSNACSPDRPQIWLCHQIQRDLPAPPEWMTRFEADTMARLEGVRRREFLASRWLMRQGISQASGTAPEHCQPVDGRPVATVSPPHWCLSLSHSRELAAVATGGRPLGIDIEPGQRKPDWTGVARRWFSPVEQEWLFRADDPFSFLQVWTLKEAWLKATGRGIAGNLQTLEVRKNFELYGDQPDGLWQASCFYAEGFVITLVHQASTDGKRTLWPDITLLEPPADDFALTPARPTDTSWEPLFQRIIRARR